MSICADKDWTMDLVKDRPPNAKEAFSFKDIRVVNGILTGRAYDLNKYSELRGSCFSFGPVAHMTFFFTAVRKDGKYVDIVISGGGYQVPGEQPRFTGRFEVFKSAYQGPSGAMTAFDEGDTGTGTGMQAQAAPPNRT